MPAVPPAVTGSPGPGRSAYAGGITPDCTDGSRRGRDFQRGAKLAHTAAAQRPGTATLTWDTGYNGSIAVITAIRPNGQLSTVNTGKAMGSMLQDVFAGDNVFTLTIANGAKQQAVTIHVTAASGVSTTRTSDPRAATLICTQTMDPCVFAQCSGTSGSPSALTL